MTSQDYALLLWCFGPFLECDSAPLVFCRNEKKEKEIMHVENDIKVSKQ